MEWNLVFATWGLVLVTFLLVIATFWMSRQQAQAVRDDLRARLQLVFIDRFDAPRMIKARKELAALFGSNPNPDQINETVPEFFEDMSLFLRRGYLDEELIWSTFGFYCVRWWAICKDYIIAERSRQMDPTLFKNFEQVADNFRCRDAKAGLPTAIPYDLNSFILEEFGLER